MRSPPTEAPAKPRVLHVLGELRPSGAEVMMRVAAPYFRDSNVVCEILSTGPQSAGVFAQALRDAGYRVHHLPFSRSLRFFRDMRTFVRQGRYDIVHLHGEGASQYTSVSVMPFASVVRTVHNNFTFAGWLRIRRRLTRLMNRALGVRYLAIGPSVQVTEWNNFANPTQLCLNWYDSDHFRLPTAQERDAARKSFGLTDGDLAVISVGNCSPVKNHMAIIDALVQLPRTAPIVYLHAGCETERGEERAAATRLGLGNQVRFLGVLSDIRPLLHAADLLAMPSLFEGLPISLLEALACGLPALLADTPGLREFRDWFPGLLYCEPNATDVARALKSFAEMPASERRAQSSQWSEKAEQTFGVREGVRRYLSVYDAILHA